MLLSLVYKALRKTDENLTGMWSRDLKEFLKVIKVVLNI
jgi:hypothetical protein